MVILQIRHVCGIGSENWRGKGTFGSTIENVQHGPYSENYFIGKLSPYYIQYQNQSYFKAFF